MRGAERSLLIVNFHSAELAIQAIASARAACSTALEVVVVDNSVDPMEIERLEHAGADRLLPAPRNLGYAGGINFGARQCSGGAIVIANADVIFRRQAIDRLAEGLTEEVALCGPKLTWDDSDEWLMPPAEPSTRLQKLSEAVASRWRGWRTRRSSARLIRRLRFWSLKASARVRAISGAVMCVGSEALEALGGFDERFQLYFEEIDFMRRLRRTGKAIEYNPAAVCRHLYNQSAARDPASATRYFESERAFHEKWSGKWFVSLIDRIAASENRNEIFETLSIESEIQVGGDPAEFVIEASPLPDFDVAVGYFPRKPSVQIPHEIWSAYHEPSLYVRVIDLENMKVKARYRFDKPIKMAYL